MAALLVFLTACGSSAAHSSAGPPASATTGASSPGGTPAAATACGPAGATTLAADGGVRVYVARQIVYGCSALRRRSFRLGHAERVFAESRVGPVAVAGEVAAYGLTDFGVDTVRASVVVRRLTDGAQLNEFAATHAVGAESFQSIGSVVVRPDGAVAWIGSLRSIIGHRSATEVHEATTSGDRVLDSGPGIAATSLRLRDGTLSWVNGGVTRHAALR
jgi:hypothetical protein